MKQFYWKMAIIVITLMICMSASGYDFEVNGIFYGYNASDQTAYVTYGTEKYSGDVVIPESVTYNGRTLAVTAIGEEAFTNCSDIQSISLPNNLTNIGDFAFFCCGSLQSIRIPNNVTYIGMRAFARCTLLRYINIPSGVTQIEVGTFQNCENLETLVIEDGTNELNIDPINGGNPFENCNPKAVFIGRSISSYPYYNYLPISSTTTLSIGEYVKRVSCKINESSIKIIYSMSEEPAKASFSNSTYLNSILYVPTGFKEKYMAADGWKNFFNIQEMDVADMWDGKSEPTNGDSKEKCEKPTIRYSNGKLLFESATEGALCQSTITDSDITSYSGNEVQLGVTYNISVYATATGCEDSDVATATLCWIDVDPKTEGIENNVSQVRARAILIQANNGTLSISGAEDGTNIDIYTSSGMMIGSVKSSGKSTSIATGLINGEVAIVKIGEKVVKVFMK